MVAFFSPVYAQVRIDQEWPLAIAFPSLGDFVSSFLPRILLFGGVIFFGLIIFAGTQVLTNAGSSDAHAKERWIEILRQGLIGLIIMFAAYWIVQIINVVSGNAFGGIL